MQLTIQARVPVVTLIMVLSQLTATGSEQTVRRAGVMREGPASFFPVVRPLEPGMTVTLEETRGTWLRGRVEDRSGWMARLVFEGVSAGVDYTGMLGSEKAVVISSVDIAAATKGAFEANYSESHQVDFGRVDTLERIQLAPALVTRIQQSLPPHNPRILRVLPSPVFDNNIIIRQDAEHLLGRALTATLVAPGYIADQDVIAYVNAIAAIIGAVTPRYDLPFRVALIDDDSVNGFGLPGGNVVLTRGLLGKVQNEAELACQIGHEIAHITLYHGLREFRKRGTHRKRDSAFAELDEFTTDEDPFAEINTLTGGSDRTAVEADLTRLANTSYLTIIGRRAREDELEADLFGVAYAAAAGYDPNAMITYLERVQAHGIGPDAFRHHPGIPERISALRDHIRRYRLTAGHSVLHEERFKIETASLRTGKANE